MNDINERKNSWETKTDSRNRTSEKLQIGGTRFKQEPLLTVTLLFLRPKQARYIYRYYRKIFRNLFGDVVLDSFSLKNRNQLFVCIGAQTAEVFTRRLLIIRFFFNIHFEGRILNLIQSATNKIMLRAFPTHEQKHVDFGNCYTLVLNVWILIPRGGRTI